MIRFVKGAAVCLSGSFVGKFLQLLSTLALARMLSSSDLGLFFLGFSFNSVLSIIATAGLRFGTVRFVSIHHGEKNFSAMRGIILISSGITFCISLIMIILLYTSRQWITTELFNKPEFLTIIPLFIITISTESQRLIFTAATEGMKIMRYSTIINQIAFNFIQLLCFILFVYFFDMGVCGAALAFSVTSIAGMILAIITTHWSINLLCNYSNIIFSFRDLIKFSLTMLPASLLFNASRQMDILMLGAIGTATMVGIYSIAVRLTNFSETIFTAFQQVLNPYIADYHAKNDNKGLADIFHFSSKWCFVISMPLFLFFCFFPSFFMGLFNETLIQGAICLVILASAHQVSSLSNLSSAILAMSGHSRLSLFNNFMFILASIILNLSLIPNFGFTGAAASHMISIIILTALRFHQVNKLFHLNPFNQVIIKSWIFGLLSISPSLMIYGFNGIKYNNQLIFSFILFCIFFLLMINFWLLDKKEIELFKTIFSNIHSLSKKD